MSQSVKGPNLLGGPPSLGGLGEGSRRQSVSGGGAFGRDLPDLEGCIDTRISDAEAVWAAEQAIPAGGILVIGMGDEQRGDGGIGLHLMLCLQQMDWPANVTFSRADADIHRRAGHFQRVIVLDAIEGPGSPGSLYQADPEDLLTSSAGVRSGAGLLPMLSPAIRRRLSVFGVQPGSTSWGSPLSAGVLASVPILLSYLRARILQVAADHQAVN